MEANSNSAISGKLVHIGAEVLVLVSVVFYLNGQLKSMKNEIRELRAKLEDQTEGMNRHLTKLYSMVDGIQSRPSFPSHLLSPGVFPGSPVSPEGGNWGHGGHHVPRPVPIPVSTGLRQRHPKVATAAKVQPSAKPSQSVPAKHSHKSVQFSRQEPIIPEEQEEPELPDEDTLDEELKNELAEMEAMESLEENEEEPEEEKTEHSRQSKVSEQPAQDLSFVQSAIRQTARKPPIVKKTP